MRPHIAGLRRSAPASPNKDCRCSRTAETSHYLSAGKLPVARTFVDWRTMLGTGGRSRCGNSQAGRVWPQIAQTIAGSFLRSTESQVKPVVDAVDESRVAFVHCL